MRFWWSKTEFPIDLKNSIEQKRVIGRERGKEKRSHKEAKSENKNNKKYRFSFIPFSFSPSLQTVVAVLLSLLYFIVIKCVYVCYMRECKRTRFTIGNRLIHVKLTNVEELTPEKWQAKNFSTMKAAERSSIFYSHFWHWSWYRPHCTIGHARKKKVNWY